MRRVRSVAFKKELWRVIRYGEYVSSCQCCKSFHSHPADVPLKAKYDNQVRDLVLDRLLKDKLNASAVLESLKRDFFLELSTGFLYDCLDFAIRRFDGNEFRAKVLAEFSGALCVDEIHLGHRVVLIASDPIADNPVGVAIVSSNDADHMRRFLKNLKNHGFEPKTVISDRSQLYPTTIAEVWPNAKHQLCVFHVISELNGHVLDAVRDVRRAIKPKRIKKGRGRPGKSHRKRVKDLKAKRDQSEKLFRRRHLIVTKESKMSEQDKTVLEELLNLSPELPTLRSFVKDIQSLFALRRTKQKAWKIWRRIVSHRTYLANPHLQKAIAVLTKANVEKLLYYLDRTSDVRTKVRTNNHVERCNRVIRYLEKVRYKWRRRKTILRHILLQFQNWINRKEIAGARAA